MPLMRRVGQYALLTLAVLLLASCAGQKERAGKIVGDIEATVIAASSEAAKYVPGQLADVQTRLEALKAAYTRKNYAEVVLNGPPVLMAAQALATAAAARKDEILKALEDQWTELAGVLPGYMTAIQNRIDTSSKKTLRRPAAGVDLDAAKAGASEAASLWSKAQAAFATGNLEEAVTTAKAVKEKLLAVAGALKMEVAPPA